MKKRKAVIIFVKFPEKGKAKTRLASTTNDNFAVEIYKLIAGNIFNQLELLTKDVDVFLFYANVDDLAKIKKWVGKDFFFRVQRGNILGEKMKNAFEEVFANDYDNVMIIGSDIPEISNELLRESFIQLESSDIVIAPSDDGGYSLLGMNQPNHLLFQDIEWSTESVLSETIKIINSNRLKLKMIDTLNDIDTIDELVGWMKVSKNKSMIKEINTIAERESVIL